MNKISCIYKCFGIAKFRRMLEFLEGWLPFLLLVVGMGFVASWVTRQSTSVGIFHCPSRDRGWTSLRATDISTRLQTRDDKDVDFALGSLLVDGGKTVHASSLRLEGCSEMREVLFSLMLFGRTLAPCLSGMTSNQPRRAESKDLTGEVATSPTMVREEQLSRSFVTTLRVRDLSIQASDVCLCARDLKISKGRIGMFATPLFADLRVGSVSVSLLRDGLHYHASAAKGLCPITPLTLQNVIKTTKDGLSVTLDTCRLSMRSWCIQEGNQNTIENSRVVKHSANAGRFGIRCNLFAD